MVSDKKAEERKEIFKKCPMCAAVWRDRMGFVRDGDLEIEGYQADFDNIAKGIIYFTHMVEGCHSTMSVRAGEFFDLNPDTPHLERMTMTEDCPGYCLQTSNIEMCSASCECAYVRDLLQILQSYKRIPAGGARAARA